ncbi:ATP-binding protein [Propioniciclava sp. MC1595]|uniref:ATP-binding protein n=1 Tax=Propioniciclava sp. MC1595 TaxID=2760308 RepID=UPI001662445C|nr:ATP-binding protein [Propioniciclava sp. MC1595]MBB1496119.1 ATP-binding protein [Propioniciclava sp. MC1595]QTE26398.1 ATP-binding protein [Propioniciclava sp. MC1595]
MTDEWDIAEPRADALIESLRAFGYSPESAIADLVDNSISAGAKLVEVDFHWDGGNSSIRVTDDGQGITEPDLVSAMRPGSTSPSEERAHNDLGRFGLGLKTASFSQARELTVVSRSARTGQVSTRRWDLDTVALSGEWRLLRTPPNGFQPDPPPQPSGTVVQWTKADRLVGESSVTDTKAHHRFLQVTDRVRRHLEATFHRFLVGAGRVQITINGKPIDPWDPFLLSHSATQVLAEESLPYRGDLIRVTSYVLPHRNKLSEEAADRHAGAAGWNQQQGFYVYRSNRLLVQGDWLGLGFSKDEHTKLARIAVEFPSSLDHHWQVDVKKSTARPPGELHEHLRRIARATRSRAEQVYRHRGKLLARKTSQPFVFGWLEILDRAGHKRYKINREHPVIQTLIAEAGDKRQLIQRALKFAEETVPVPLIGISVAAAVEHAPAPFDQHKRDLGSFADFAYMGLLGTGLSPEVAIERLAAAEPFNSYPEIIATLKETHI